MTTNITPAAPIDPLTRLRELSHLADRMVLLTPERITALEDTISEVESLRAEAYEGYRRERELACRVALLRQDIDALSAA